MYAAAMVNILPESTFGASCHYWLCFFIQAVELQSLSDTRREPRAGVLDAIY